MFLRKKNKNKNQQQKDYGDDRSASPPTSGRKRSRSLSPPSPLDPSFDYRGGGGGGGGGGGNDWQRRSRGSNKRGGGFRDTTSQQRGGLEIGEVSAEKTRGVGVKPRVGSGGCAPVRAGCYGFFPNAWKKFLARDASDDAWFDASGGLFFFL